MEIVGANLGPKTWLKTVKKLVCAVAVLLRQQQQQQQQQQRRRRRRRQQSTQQTLVPSHIKQQQRGMVND